MAEIEACRTPGCTKQATMALDIDRKKRERLMAKIDFDNRTAPKKSIRYCGRHGREAIGGLFVALLPPDQEMQGQRAGTIVLDDALHSDNPRAHDFEAGEGSSGMVCTRMAMRDGGGDACGATPDEHSVAIENFLVEEDLHP